MSNEYLAKVFKSGNSVALRLPRAMGLKVGDVMRVREEQGGFLVEHNPLADDRIDLTGICGSIPGIARPSWDDQPRDWNGRAADA